MPADILTDADTAKLNRLAQLAQTLFPNMGMALLVFDTQPRADGKEPLLIATNVPASCLLYKLESYKVQVAEDAANIDLLDSDIQTNLH